MPPYRYRDLTAEQQVDAVRDRLDRGHPAHEPPHPDQGTGWYFITAACFEHRRRFEQPAELAALAFRLGEALRGAGYGCGGWVVLPNHYHLLVHAPALTGFGRVLGRVHARSAAYANERDGTPGRQVWYRYSDRKVRSERHFGACLHYLFLNPVKHGYVDDPRSWRWSSLGEWLSRNGEQRFVDLQENYPLREFGRGWDD
ncbi:REP-associated tyrosine transposase [Alienimonas chondri]|uniref:Transposase IS200-like domain-containing protein n=1 Tax=Alienimonas chondri TaxID=2681879 RepID=A0ABX1VII5_9PLAN|nr:transposase [Alienimonas chondri]NNJ26626.1 hypothetical protein [Alienimonas chondri]